jgi:hypothetical protein
MIRVGLFIKKSGNVFRERREAQVITELRKMSRKLWN